MLVFPSVVAARSTLLSIIRAEEGIWLTRALAVRAGCLRRGKCHTIAGKLLRASAGSPTKLQLLPNNKGQKAQEAEEETSDEQSRKCNARANTAE